MPVTRLAFLFIFVKLALEILHQKWYNVYTSIYIYTHKVRIMINKKHIGSSFDSFLEEQGILEESEAVAIKRVLAYALEEKMIKENISKNRVAKELETSRPAVERLLDPENTSITLNTIEKVAKYVNKRLKLSFA